MLSAAVDMIIQWGAPVSAEAQHKRLLLPVSPSLSTPSSWLISCTAALSNWGFGRLHPLHHLSLIANLPHVSKTDLHTGQSVKLLPSIQLLAMVSPYVVQYSMKTYIILDCGSNPSHLARVVDDKVRGTIIGIAPLRALRRQSSHCRGHHQ